jgi:LPS-assembly protein
LVLDKIFGLAYEEDIPTEYIKKRKLKEGEEEKLKPKKTDGQVIGELPSLGGVSEDTFKVIHNSYRHRQNIKLKHYFLSDQDTAGNPGFFSQIQEDNGQFDPIDTIRSREFLANNETSRTTLPLNNTIELQWNNSLIRKRSRGVNLYKDSQTLRENFSYDLVGYFNVSQGYDLYRDRDVFGKELSLEDKLTRLFIDTGVTINQTTFNVQEFYFYDTQEHILRVGVNQNFDRGQVGAAIRYNSFRVPVDKFISTNGTVRLTDLFTIQGAWEFDIEESRTNQSRYGVIYTPYNNCWRLNLDYLKTIAEKRFSFNFLINFNDGFQGFQQ